jgi:hypothetical protein
MPRNPPLREEDLNSGVQPDPHPAVEENLTAATLLSCRALFDG